jgi:hypothetical protein
MIYSLEQLICPVKAISFLFLPHSCTSTVFISSHWRTSRDKRRQHMLWPVYSCEATHMKPRNRAVEWFVLSLTGAALFEILQWVCFWRISYKYYDPASLF